jgi:cytochrome c peroxidase
MTRRTRLLTALAVVVLAVAGTTAFWLGRRSSQDDQCGKPVAERTGGWFCYGPVDDGASRTG